MGWGNYLSHICTCEDGEWITIKLASRKWDPEQVGQHEASRAAILASAFKLFTEDDWRGYASCLYREDRG